MKDDNQNKAENFWPTLVEFLFATRSWWAGVCAEFDLTPAQGQALKVLDPARPVPMSTLAEALFCDASNVTGIVDKLETRGFIARQGSDHDRRVKQQRCGPGCKLYQHKQREDIAPLCNTVVVAAQAF